MHLHAVTYKASASFKLRMTVSLEVYRLMNDLENTACRKFALLESNPAFHLEKNLKFRYGEVLI